MNESGIELGGWGTPMLVFATGRELVDASTDESVEADSLAWAR